MPNASIWQYTVVDTLVGREILELNSGRLGDWLEIEPRGSAGRKVAHSQGLVFGNSKKIARASHSLQKQNALFIDLEY